MIEKIIDFESLSGVSSPLLPLIFADGFYRQNELDGAFLQKNEKGEILTAFSLKNSCVNLTSMSDEGSEELESFFDFLGISEILSDEPLPKLCRTQKELNLLEFCGDSYEENKCQILTPKSTIGEYQDVYKVISENGNNFENWFPEFSKKINSFNAFATYIKADEMIISVAISPAIYNKTAIIAGVYTLIDYRKNGYASECVKALLNELKRNDLSKIYLWCEEKNISFYNKLNFKNIGKIYCGGCK